MTVSMRDLFGDDEPERDPGPVPESVVFVPIRAFAAEEEPGAAALLGTGDAALIPEDGDVMVYGDGGAGKTTLRRPGAASRHRPPVAGNPDLAAGWGVPDRE